MPLYKRESVARADRGVCIQCDVGIFKGQRYVHLEDKPWPQRPAIKDKTWERHISCPPLPMELARLREHERR